MCDTHFVRRRYCGYVHDVCRNPWLLGDFLYLERSAIFAGPSSWWHLRVELSVQCSMKNAFSSLFNIIFSVLLLAPIFSLGPCSRGKSFLYHLLRYTLQPRERKTSCTGSGDRHFEKYAQRRYVGLIILVTSLVRFPIFLAFWQRSATRHISYGSAYIKKVTMSPDTNLTRLGLTLAFAEEVHEVSTLVENTFKYQCTCILPKYVISYR